MTDFTLSKTKYIAGLQCPKLLWTHYHAQKMFPPTDVQTQAIFDQGHEVTAIARTLFPEGIEIKGFEDYDAVLGQTQQLLAQRKPLFEPAFRYKNTFARADVLNPNSDDSWDLYEVKSSTEAKDVHYPDLAFQKYCYQGSGLRIKRCYLILVNNSYIRKGALDPKQFLSILDISKEVEPLVGTIEKNLEQMLKILNEKSSPEVKIGPHCNEPYECGLKEHCWDFLPEDHVFVLSRLNKVKGFQLIEKKICKVTEIPEDFKLTDNQRVQWQCHKSGETHRNISEIKNFISQLKFPIYFLDFETVSPAIPFYDLSWPYQQVPFQFSLH
ncbi:MAG: DUF2779 domain-containing protein, partial [Candidatus Omnitrophica bacterium]|nr:DUF2779 domain-containing protein [Candidatus Omnitrophota bacterium]